MARVFFFSSMFNHLAVVHPPTFMAQVVASLVLQAATSLAEPSHCRIAPRARLGKG
jgi:hypothetical protein